MKTTRALSSTDNCTIKRTRNKKFAKTEAVVEKIKELPKNGEPEKKVKCPVVSFKAGETEMKACLYDFACDEDKVCKLGEGDSVKIVYERKRPDRIFPDSEIRFRKVQMIFGAVVGVMLIAAGVIIRGFNFYK